MSDVRHDWFDGFFEGLAVELWVAAVPDEATAAEVDLIVAELRLEPGARVLDVPIGHGRHAIALGRRGHRVTGVDISAEFLARARAAASGAGVELELHEADMRELPWAGAFDGAYCCGNSFGYLDRDGSAQFAAAVAGALRPGARFLLETNLAAESILPRLTLRHERVIDGITMSVEHRYDAAASRMDGTYRFEREGRVDVRELHYWIFTAGEIQRMLSDAGLRIVAVYGGPDRGPYEVGSGRLIVVAEREA
ncbi:MAG: SAM-dependent methyltransferase [Solirubrobacteraceae bacterium]